MPATGVQANWAAVSFNSTPIKRVTNVTFDRGGSTTAFRGDTDVYPTVIASLAQNPGCTITTADVAALMGIADGASGTITATHKDARAATGGDVVYVLSNAVFETASANGPQGAFGTVQASFKAYSTDGTTNPLAFTRA